MGYNDTNSLGTAFFYIGFGLFSLAAGAFLISAIKSRTNKQRTYSVTSTMIVSIAATAYLVMAMGSGFTFRTDGRQVYYARYIDWFFTTPLLLYDLGNFAGVGLNQIILAIFFDIIMILMGLFSALSNNVSRRWVWFGMGNLAFIPILYLVLINFRKYRRAEVKYGYNWQSGLLAGLWFLYPIATGLGVNGLIISSDAETVWITCVDVAAKAVYGSLWLTAWRNDLPYAEGEIADRVAQAPRHPNEQAPPPGVHQPIDNHTPYHQAIVANPDMRGVVEAPHLRDSPALHHRLTPKTRQPNFQ